MLIKSLQLTSDSVSISYAYEQSNGFVDQLTLKSKDLPSAELRNAFSALKDIFLIQFREFCDFSDNLWLFKVNFKYSELEFDKLSLTGSLPFETGRSISFSTSWWYPDEKLISVETLLEEANRYVKGKRAQVNLFEVAEKAE